MWDSVVRLVESDNGWFVLIIIGLIGFAIRQGYMKVKTDKLLLGKDCGDRERLLIKKQVDYAHGAIMALEKKIPRFDGYNEYLGKYMAELAFDEIVNWITVNHIQPDEDYISIKQNIIWDLVLAETVDDRVKTDKVKKIVFANIEDIIKRLYQMRVNEMEG